MSQTLQISAKLTKLIIDLTLQLAEVHSPEYTRSGLGEPFGFLAYGTRDFAVHLLNLFSLFLSQLIASLFGVGKVKLWQAESPPRNFACF
jgi:hypothetical protein